MKTKTYIFDDGTEPTVMRCTGPCDQGDKSCPCPVACEAHDESSYYTGVAGAILGCAAVVAVVGGIAFLVGVLV